MRGLLKPKERRQLEIVEFLLDTNDWVTMADLSKIFNCSIRIIKSDIGELKKQLPGVQFQSGYLGIRLSKHHSTSIQGIYSVILNDTLIFQLLEAIFFDESLSVESLAEKFFVSTSTIYRAITQINDYFKELFLLCRHIKIHNKKRVKHTWLHSFCCDLIKQIFDFIKETRIVAFNFFTRFFSKLLQ